MSLQNGKWLVDGSVDYDKLNIADGDLSIAKTSGLQGALDNKVETSALGVSVATLVAGKVPVAQLPNAIMEYQGVWDASTNSPSLADGVGNADTAIGDIYRVSVGGTVDFGAGNIEFSVGDYVILNSSKIWEKADMSDGVVSVNGAVGIVVLDADDIDDTSTTNKFATAAELSQIATNTSDISDLQTDSHTHTNKAILDATTASFVIADETKLDFISVTQAVDLDSIESDLAGHIDGGANKHDASEIDVETAGNYTSVADLETNLGDLDAQIKANADAIAAVSVPASITEEFVLDATDISNQYVTLSNTPSYIISVSPDGGPVQRSGVDFTLTTAQLDFAGDLASLLEAGDVLIVKYQY